MKDIKDTKDLEKDKDLKNTDKDKKKKKGNWKKWKDKRDRNSRPLGKPTNSPQWYYPNPEIQKLASAVNFNNRNGLKVEYADGVNLKNASMATLRMPGVAVNPVFHIPGIAKLPNDPLNEATRAQMNRIRENINATRQYEMPDLGKYLFAVADLNAWIEFLKLIYRTARKYNPLNMYTPTAILRGLHVDTSDINNLGIQLKFYINTLVYRVKNLKVPLDIPLLPTWIEDYKHIFVDEDIAKAQYIVNAPKYVNKYTIGSDSKSHIVPKIYFTKASADNPYTVQDLIDFTEDLLSELLNDEDFAIITGDIMKCYSNFYELSEVGDEIIEFEYSKEFLEKWHNAAIFPDIEPDASTITGWEIVEDTTTYLDPFLVFNPIYTAPNQASYDSVMRGGGNRMLDFYDKEVTSDQIINGSLWLWTFEAKDSAARKVQFREANTSLIGGIEFWYLNNDGVLSHFNYYGVMHLELDASNKQKAVYANNHLMMSIVTKWNYYPFTVMLLDANAITASDTGFLGLMGDLGNYVVVDGRILSNMSTCVLYGQYNINYLLAG